MLTHYWLRFGIFSLLQLSLRFCFRSWFDATLFGTLLTCVITVKARVACAAAAVAVVANSISFHRRYVIRILPFHHLMCVPMSSLSSLTYLLTGWNRRRRQWRRMSCVLAENGKIKKEKSKHICHDRYVCVCAAFIRQYRCDSSFRSTKFNEKQIPFHAKLNYQNLV